MYRLCEDWKGLLEGSVISDEQYKKLWYLDKASFEVITEEDERGMIEHKDEKYCRENNVEKLLFWSDEEKDEFINKAYAIGD